MDSLQNNRELPLDDLMPMIREQLNRGQTVRFSPRGTSMLPMIRQGIDQVVLSPLPQKLERFDLPLYQRTNGQYVLHRIVEIRDDTYTCMGDNQFQKEPELHYEQMIAKVTAFYRAGKRYEVTDLCYKAYCIMWYHTRHIRRCWLRCKSIVRRLMK